MKSRWLAAALPLLLFVPGACTAKYQDLLRDRDAQIRELQGEVADLRATNADLERLEQAARAELDRARSQLATPAAPTDLDRVRDDLAGLDVRYNRGRISIGIDNTVTFASGSTALKSSASSVLNRVANVLNRDFGDRRIYIEGHTDTDPIRHTKARFRSNRHLSAERADAVADFLVSKAGIGQDRVVVVGFGPHDPRDPGSSDSAKARNRRVEIVVGEPL